MPELDQSKDYSVLKVDPEQKFTKGPARFTEAKLVRSMEEKGIAVGIAAGKIIDVSIGKGGVLFDMIEKDGR